VKKPTKKTLLLLIDDSGSCDYIICGFEGLMSLITQVAPGAEKVSHLPDVQGTAQRHRQLKSINDDVQQKH